MTNYTHLYTDNITIIVVLVVTVQHVGNVCSNFIALPHVGQAVIRGEATGVTLVTLVLVVDISNCNMHICMVKMIRWFNILIGDLCKYGTQIQPM